MELNIDEILTEFKGPNLPFWAFFISLLALALALAAVTAQGGGDGISSDFRWFQGRFLVVYYCLVFADWLQGPNSYAVYASRGYSQSEISFFFVIGYASSLVLGTALGSLADTMGRRLTCIVLCGVYGVTCVALHSSSFPLLVIGRVCGGLSASLLGSAPEAWMIDEHTARGFDPSWTASTTASMAFGSGMAAILAGVVSTPLTTALGPTGPFDLSFATLLFSAILLLLLWNENYGRKEKETKKEEEGGAESRMALVEGVMWLFGSLHGMLLGVSVAAFEGAMFLFVFAWTPSLESSFATISDSPLPHGVVFAAFMAAVMLGSKLFQVAVSQRGLRSSTVLTGATMLGSIALFLPASFSTNLYASLAGMCAFEVACGLYFPSAGTLKGQVVPSTVRATVSNLFRVGLNAIVVTVLLGFTDIKPQTVMFVAASLLALATASAGTLDALLQEKPKKD